MNDVDKGFEHHRAPRMGKLPIILSEADPEGCAACSMKVNPANAYRNGTLYPSYTAAAYKGLFELADRHKVNLISMLSWSFEFENKDYFEGFRSLSTNGIDKPVLNFFRMAALMKGGRVGDPSSGQVKLDDIMAERRARRRRCRCLCDGGCAPGRGDAVELSRCGKSRRRPRRPPSR